MQPTYQSGFASPRRGGLKYPKFWRGRVGSWCPSLGVTGNTLFDHSGFGNHGALTNGPTWDVSEGRHANGFDGVDDRILIQSPKMPSSEYTMCGWFFANSLASSKAIVSMGDHSVADQVLNFSSSRLHLISYHSIGVDTLLANTTLLTGKWYHGCLTRTQSTLAIYLDGRDDGSMAVGSTSANYGTTPTMDIGSRGSVGGSFFSGSLDDIRIYNRALPQNEITQLYQLGRGGSYARRRDSIGRAGFKSYWARRQSQIIGGGVG